jgi:hypothetical protein
MDRLLAIAAENGCGRVEWAADTNNPLALGFYAELKTPEAYGR